MASLSNPTPRVSGAKLIVGGRLRVPGDKSISHRALILAAVARGSSRVDHVLDAQDIRSTADALRELGAEVPALSPRMYVQGRQLHSPNRPLDCGNSGTTARLLAGVVAGAGLRATLHGDESLSRRPMRRIAEPLNAMGARVDPSPGGGLPMTVVGGRLHEIEYQSSVASAQVKSAILLAAVLSRVRVRLSEPHLSRDHTERMLAARGVALRRNATPGADGAVVEIAPAQEIRPLDTRVPGDPSSAAFFLALALLASKGELAMEDVCLNETRTGFLEALRLMGGRVSIEERREEGGEPVGTIVASPSELTGVEVAEDVVPSMIDELPLLACLAARARGQTIVRGAAELRVKESDRIAAVVGNLRRLGCNAEELTDGFRVVGGESPLRGTVTTHGDHRIAMAFGVLSALPGNRITIDNPECVAVSYPGFWSDLKRVQQ